MTPKPDAFLSYTRFDDRRGKITEFRQWLSEAVQEVSGKPFQIFQDVDDEEGIALGQKWKDVLDDMLDQARFFIPILTPSFFESQPCRAELKKFLELEQQAGRQDLVLPIYYIECPVLEDPSLLSQDALAVIVSDRQHWNWRKLRHRPFNEVAEQLEALARQIERARRQRFTVIETTQKVAATGGARTAKLEVVEPAKVPKPTGPADLTVIRDGEFAPELVVLPRGEFPMGSCDPEAPDENPQHRVWIDYRMAVGRYPVTFEEWDQYARDAAWHRSRHMDPYEPKNGGWGRGKRPVINVSWEDVQGYLHWLSEKTGHRYRLLSEAEWEYACRAGTTAAYHFGPSLTHHDANFDKKVGKTVEAGSYSANSWGLYDMHGNVGEWVEDCWNENYEGAPTDGSAWLSGDCSLRVVRGSSWNDQLSYLRSAFRNWKNLDDQDNHCGFRVARTLS